MTLKLPILAPLPLLFSVLFLASALQADDTDIFGNPPVNSLGFAPPATTDSATTSFRTAEEIYYIMVRTDSGPSWRGNLKKYKVGTDNLLYDVNDNLAFDTTTNFIANGARSFWGSQTDGSNIKAGGMAAHISQSRLVVSNISGNTNVTLNTAANHLSESNSSITNEMLAVDSSTNRNLVLRWGRGVDVDDEDSDGSTTDHRTSVGDPLHTQPRIITYYKNSSGSVVDRTVYFTTNDGFLHAVNTDNGSTEFAFIPKELLPNLKIYKEDLVAGAPRDTGPTSNSGCVWDYKIPGSCIPDTWCSYQYQFGDIHLSQSCRLVAPRSDGDCNWDYGAARCANSEFCEYRYRFGDTHLSQSCRLRSSPQLPPPPVDTLPTKVYGMDGPMGLWIQDSNGDGDVLQSNNGSPDSGDHVYLYTTMRRGGSNVYALDITQRNNPRLKWVIRGDLDKNRQADNTSHNPNFPELGQTWSMPSLAKVRYNGSDRQVLIFGSGYDQDADEQTAIGNNDIGRGIYMVDANSGQKLWSAGISNSNLNLSNMTYSVAADLTLMDINNDGLLDFFYAADIGGQIWRFDVNQNNSGSGNFASGGRIAKLSGSSQSDARRFYYAPDVAFSRDFDHLKISIGSGFRAKPLSTHANDAIYVIHDPNVYNTPSSYNYDNGSIITESSLFNTTANLIQVGNSSERATATSNLENSKGWYIRLPGNGEKILGRTRIFNNVVTFTSYVPGSGGSGSNFLYTLNIDSGIAVLNLDGVNAASLTTSDRRRNLENTGLTPEPTILVRGSGGADLCVGAECFQDILRNVGSTGTHKNFWRENPR